MKFKGIPIGAYRDPRKSLFSPSLQQLSRKAAGAVSTPIHSRDIRVEALPFSQDVVELRRKRAETILINLALTVLKDAAYRPHGTSIATTDVRPALRVLYPFMGDRDALTAFWTAAASARLHAWEGCHTEFAVIVARIVERGYAVEAEFR